MLIRRIFCPFQSWFNWWSCMRKSSKRIRLRLGWLGILMLVSPVWSMLYLERKKLLWPVSQVRPNISKLYHWLSQLHFVIVRVLSFPEYQAHRLKWFSMVCIQWTHWKPSHKQCKFSVYVLLKKTYKIYTLYIGKRTKFMTVRKSHKNTPCWKDFIQAMVYQTNQSHQDI